MKKEKVFDNDCKELYDEITKDGLNIVIAPAKIIKHCLYWIMEEDSEAELYFIHMDKEYDTKGDEPYVLFYYPGKVYSVGLLDSSVSDIDCPIYIYDLCSSKYLKMINEYNATPFCLQSDIEEEKEAETQAEVKETPVEEAADEIQLQKEDEDSPLHGFSEYKTDKYGNSLSYSFYSTDAKLVEKMAQRRMNARGKAGNVKLERKK